MCSIQLHFKYMFGISKVTVGADFYSHNLAVTMTMYLYVLCQKAMLICMCVELWSSSDRDQL